MKSKNCSHDVEESEGYCEECGKEIVLVHEMKKCPSCKDFQKADVRSCTSCKKGLIICKEKKEDGSKCEAFIAEKQNCCKGCGNKVQRDAHDGDEVDSRTQTQVTQPLVTAGLTGSPKEKKTESGDVADGTKVKEEIDSRESGGEDPTKKCATRGLAVICTHYSYTSTIYKLSKRSIAEIDNSLMVGAWKSYGCEILSFKEKTNKFYIEELTSEIEDKLKDMKSIDYFVFVLSTHGDESIEGLVNTDGDESHEGLVTDGEKSGEVNIEEKKKPLFHEYVHYFYSKDDRYKTQVLIDAIGNIKGLEGKLKMFFIQACRARFNTENQDHGHDIAVVKRIINPPDAVPTEDDQIKLSKPKTEGVDKEDAKGYMPEEEKCTHPDNLEEIPTAVAELHCNDSVVAFASMSGKYAYRKENDPNQGSWLIRALHTVMIEHTKLEDNVHILDILTGVNREVSDKETNNEKKSQSCFLHNLTFSDEQLQFKYQHPVDKHKP